MSIKQHFTEAQSVLSAFLADDKNFENIESVTPIEISPTSAKTVEDATANEAKVTIFLVSIFFPF
jgi:hypothetical protein